MAKKKSATVPLKEANDHWTALRSDLKSAGAGSVITGYHEDGFFYVHLDTETALMDDCIAVLVSHKYLAARTGRAKPKRYQGDIAGVRKRSHEHVEAYRKLPYGRKLTGKDFGDGA
jgi:hypothetical protein